MTANHILFYSVSVSKITIVPSLVTLKELVLVLIGDSAGACVHVQKNDTFGDNTADGFFSPSKSGKSGNVPVDGKK